MGRIKLFLITLAGNNSVYYSGSNIEGNVVLELSEPKKMEGISVTLTGQAIVKWSEQRTTGSGDIQHTECVNHYDSETILNSVSIQLWGDGTSSQELAAGRYEFPFKFQLPSNTVLPTSFESHIGFIRYQLSSTISRSWKFNHTTKRTITISEVVDTNTPELGAELSSSKEKTLCCLYCTSGPISLSVTTDRGGYCPGESIAIRAEVENHSNRGVSAVRANLQRKVIFYAKEVPYFQNIVIRKIEGAGIKAGSTSTLRKLLPIPPTVPCIASCRIIKVSYVLQLTLAIPFTTDLTVAIPITIGNVPFSGGQAAASSYPSTQPSYPNPYPLPVTSDVVHPPPAENPHFPILNYSTVYPPVNIGEDKFTMRDTQHAPVNGFVTDYQFAPPKYFEVVSKVEK